MEVRIGRFLSGATIGPWVIVLSFDSLVVAGIAGQNLETSSHL